MRAPNPRLEPRGLRRDDAAAYVGLGATKFDELVAAGRMPKPFRIDGAVRWDRKKLDAALGGFRPFSWLFSPDEWLTPARSIESRIVPESLRSLALPRPERKNLNLSAPLLCAARRCPAVAQGEQNP